MKKMTRSLAVIAMALVAMLAAMQLAGCGASEEEKIVGTWKFQKIENGTYTFAVGDELRQEILTPDFIVLVFNEDGTATYTMSGETTNCTWEKREGQWALIMGDTPQLLTFDFEANTVVQDMGAEWVTYGKVA